MRGLAGPGKHGWGRRRMRRRAPTTIDIFHLGIETMDRRNFLQAAVAGAVGLQAPDRTPQRRPWTTNRSRTTCSASAIRTCDMPATWWRTRRPATLASVNQRLTTVRDVVGFGNFNVLSFDEMLEFGRRYSQIGEFTRSELDLLESLFYEDASRYGFFGEKPLGRITERVDLRDVVKIPYTGHYVFSGKSLALYEKVLKQVGGNLTLTSGCAASSSRCSSSSPRPTPQTATSRWHRAHWRHRGTHFTA